VQIKAMACELPATTGLPLSRFSRQDLVQEAARRGIAAQISGTTIWRWLAADAIRPWQHRSWIFPRDKNFAEKAGRVLDLYQGVWQGQALGSDEFVISADEKTSIQARIRLHPSLPPQSGEPMRVEFEYERGGALAYIAAWTCSAQKSSAAAVRSADRALRRVGPKGDESISLPGGQASFLDRGQRFLASRRSRLPAPARRVCQPSLGSSPGPCELA